MQQQEILGVTRRMYESASHLVRRARRNRSYQRELWAVRQFFSPGFAWRRAVELACEVHGVDFYAVEPPTHH